MVEMRPEPPKSPEQAQIEAIAAQQEVYRKQLADSAYEGEQMATWMREQWPYLFEKVIGPMEKEAYATFRHTNFDPLNPSAVVQVQAILRVVDLIKTKTDSMISRAKDARSKLSEMQNSTQKEGE